MWKYINDKGFTLIELLISLSILSIVLISFFTFFTSTFRVNSMNSNDIQAMNVAREYKELIDKDSESTIANEIEIRSQKTITGFTIGPEDLDPDYDVTVTISAAEEPNSFFPIHRVHIEVQKDGKLLSETYTYYEAVAEETSS